MSFDKCYQNPKGLCSFWRKEKHFGMKHAGLRPSSSIDWVRLEYTLSGVPLCGYFALYYPLFLHLWNRDSNIMGLLGLRCVKIFSTVSGENYGAFFPVEEWNQHRWGGHIVVRMSMWESSWYVSNWIFESWAHFVSIS